MLHIEETEHPLSLQIFGGDKDNLVEAARFVEANTTADIIDINMGCPVNKIIKAEAGARWLLDPDKVYEMVHAVSSAVSIPVTVKMRTGWDEEHLFAVKMLKPLKPRVLQRSPCMGEHEYRCMKDKPIGIF